MTRKKIIFSILLLCIGGYLIGDAFGHGWGTETISDVKIDDRKISVTVELPPYFDQIDEKQIRISATDSQTNESINNVTYLIGLFHDNKMILRDYFFASNGNLVINVIPTNSDEIEIFGEQDSSLGVWYATESRSIELIGPIFTSGGLFHFEIEIKTVDEQTNIVKESDIIIADVSIVQTTSYDKKSKDDNEIKFRLKSYFDKISNFEYDSQNNKVKFEMPFDWREQTIIHIPIVHEEVHFPKDFGDFLTPSYVGKVNGIKLFKSSVVIDDYTEESERIVHFILLQDHLKFLKNEIERENDELPENIVFTLEPSEKVEFPMIAMTKNEEFQVDLTWEPYQIDSEKITKFVFTIRDGSTGEPLRNSSYDFVIIQSGNEIYRTSGNAQVGGYFEEYRFEESQTGPSIIRFENIRGTGLGTEFGVVVVPEFGYLASITLLVAIVFVIILIKKNSNLKSILIQK